MAKAPSKPSYIKETAKKIFNPVQHLRNGARAVTNNTRNFLGLVLKDPLMYAGKVLGLHQRELIKPQTRLRNMTTTTADTIFGVFRADQTAEQRKQAHNADLKSAFDKVTGYGAKTLKTVANVPASLANYGKAALSLGRNGLGVVKDTAFGLGQWLGIKSLKVKGLKNRAKRVAHRARTAIANTFNSEKISDAYKKAFTFDDPKMPAAPAT